VTERFVRESCERAFGDRQKVVKERLVRERVVRERLVTDREW